MHLGINGGDQRENRICGAEIKFVVSLTDADRLRDSLRARLAPDPHATDEAGDGYCITSIYFDTPTFAVYRREGSYGRAKFRIRRYGESDGVFLERKLRTRSLVSKRRSLIGLNEVSSLEADPEGIGPGTWFGRRLRIGASRLCAK
jgi:hypothetical protein